MKKIKQITAIALLVIAIANVIIDSASALATTTVSTTYTLSVKDQKALESVKAKGLNWYKNKVAKYGKEKADQDLEQIAIKLSTMQFKSRANKRLYTVLFQLRQYMQSLPTATLSGTGGSNVVLIPVGTGASSVTTGNANSNVVGTIDPKKVDEIIATIDATELRKYPAKVNDVAAKFQALGFTQKEGRILALTVINNETAFGVMDVEVFAKKDIYFCAPFTGEIKDKNGTKVYEVFGKYSTAYGRPDERYIRNTYSDIAYGVWDYDKKMVVGGLNTNGEDEIKSQKLGFVRACAKELMDVNQVEIKTLFAKMGKTYTIQTKPFWEVDSKILDGNLGEWTKSLVK